MATQDLLASVREEILSTTKLPLAIDFMTSELKHSGVFSTAMAKLSHYFTPFQTFIVAQAESERGRFDFAVAVEILHREADYRAQEPTAQGLFLYQFETLCRNRLRYDHGLDAMAGDPIYSEDWREWLRIVRRQIGLVDLADMIYVPQRVLSASIRQRDGFQRRAGEAGAVRREGGQDRPGPSPQGSAVVVLRPAAALGLSRSRAPKPPKDERLVHRWPDAAAGAAGDARIKLVEEEQRGGIDLTKFYPPPAELDRGEE